jgi:hypothetical protein
MILTPGEFDKALPIAAKIVAQLKTLRARQRRVLLLKTDLADLKQRAQIERAERLVNRIATKRRYLLGIVRALGGALEQHGSTLRLWFLVSPKGKARINGVYVDENDAMGSKSFMATLRLFPKPRCKRSAL